MEIDTSVNFRIFWSTKLIPFASEKQVGLELERMVNRGIFERLQHNISEYTSLMVVVAKRNSDALRISGNVYHCVQSIIHFLEQKICLRN